MRDKYATGPTSVDHTLDLLQLLVARGSVRVRDAAAELGLSTSAVHRYLASLRDHGYATQGPGRVYEPGPAVLSFGTLATAEKSVLRTLLPHVRLLNERLDETVHVMVLYGHDVHFIHSEESGQALRIMPRHGLSMPARLTSGGKALLACLDDEVIDRYFGDGTDDASVDSLRLELEQVRRRGYGENHEESGSDIEAVGMALRSTNGTPIAAITVALPKVRATTEWMAIVCRELTESVRAAHVDLNTKPKSRKRPAASSASDRARPSD